MVVVGERDPASGDDLVVGLVEVDRLAFDGEPQPTTRPRVRDRSQVRAVGGEQARRRARCARTAPRGAGTRRPRRPPWRAARAGPRSRAPRARRSVCARVPRRSRRRRAAGRPSSRLPRIACARRRRRGSCRRRPGGGRSLPDRAGACRTRSPAACGVWTAIALCSSRPSTGATVSNVCGASSGPGTLCVRVPAPIVTGSDACSGAPGASCSVKASHASAATPGAGW